MRSSVLTLDVRDFTHGLIVAVVGAVFASILSGLQQGGWPDWNVVGHVAIASAVAYVLKQLGTNSQGGFMQAEPPPQSRRASDKKGVP